MKYTVRKLVTYEVMKDSWRPIKSFAEEKEAIILSHTLNEGYDAGLEDAHKEATKASTKE